MRARILCVQIYKNKKINKQNWPVNCMKQKIEHKKTSLHSQTLYGQANWQQERLTIYFPYPLMLLYQFTKNKLACEKIVKNVIYQKLVQIIQLSKPRLIPHLFLFMRKWTTMQNAEEFKSRPNPPARGKRIKPHGLISI